MTHSKTAAIRTAIAVIAALFLAGYMTGDHGVKRMAQLGGVARACSDPRLEAASSGSGPPWQEPWRGRFPVVRLAPRSTSCMRPAHGKRCWKPVQAGCPRSGAIPKPVTQGRLHRPAPTDRPPESTAGNTNSPRPPAGAPGKPTAAPAASPTARGGYRTSTAPAHGGLPGAGRTAVDSTVLARTNRSSQSGSNTSPRARA